MFSKTIALDTSGFGFFELKYPESAIYAEFKLKSNCQAMAYTILPRMEAKAIPSEHWRKYDQNTWLGFEIPDGSRNAGVHVHGTIPSAECSIKVKFSSTAPTSDDEESVSVSSVLSSDVSIDTKSLLLDHKDDQTEDINTAMLLNSIIEEPESDSSDSESVVEYYNNELESVPVPVQAEEPVQDTNEEIPAEFEEPASNTNEEIPAEFEEPEPNTNEKIAAEFEEPAPNTNEEIPDEFEERLKDNDDASVSELSETKEIFQPAEDASITEEYDDVVANSNQLQFTPNSMRTTYAAPPLIKATESYTNSQSADWVVYILIGGLMFAVGLLLFRHKSKIFSFFTSKSSTA